MKINLEQQQRKRKKTIDEVFDWTMSELTKAWELFGKRKSQIILETARMLDEQTNIEKQKISTEITKRLD